MVSVTPELIDDLQDRVDSDLRVIATHDEGQYDFHYQRDDISEKYTPDEFDRIFKDLVLEGMYREHFENLFHVGQMECGVWGFEEAYIFYFPGPEYTGLVVSVDRDGPLDIDALVETCKRAVG